MIEYTASDIVANVRASLKPEDREQADIERAFWAASGAFDASERAARRHLQNMKAI